MKNESTCRKCGVLLTTQAREGICPKCLLEQALVDQTGGESVEAALESAPAIAEGPGTVIGTSAGLPSATLRAGTVIGRYKLLEKIGEGGFGAVYLAEQEEPVRRRVALKIIKLGMDTREVVARFEAERQALALMDHPNIAKVFDGGATDTGRPYFVMELVRGIPITDYCDQKRFSPKQRLELFMQVCQAVQHAHQKGIIHRDLKPSNILVTVNDGVPVPKVIDFGIAKATGQRLTDKTFYTRLNHFIGTPAYMSPEQVETTSVDIDTRSDIYSLGVIVYELLTGETPFPAKELLAAGLDQMCRTIREKEPPKPSTRIGTMREPDRATTATRRGLEASRLLHVIRGDLDWIVMMCLEKDRARRYATASSLAEDIRRHLRHEPVVAAAPSRLYRARKFVHRNKAALAAASVIVTLLVAGTVVSTWQAFRATRAGQVAERETQHAQAALTRLEIERAESLFAADRSSPALAYLARLLRRQPTNTVVAERLMSALSHRSYCLPAAQPLRHGPPMMSPAYPKNDGGFSIINYLRQGGPIRAANFSRDGLRVVTASKDGTARIWDSRTGLPVGEPLQHQAEVIWAQFSGDGKRVATASLDKTARIWDAESGKLSTPPLSHEDGVLFAEFSPDNRKLVTASLDQTVRIWDAATGKLSMPPIVNRTPVYYASFSADGSRLLTASTDARARLWKSITGEKIATFAHSMQTESLLPFPHLSADGKRIAALGGSSHGDIWDVTTGKAAVPALNHDNAMYSVRLSPDGTRVVTASIDTTARLWDAATGTLVVPPLKHENWVVSAQFDPSGQRLATTSRDNSARIWDVRTGLPLTDALRHDSCVRSAQFSPNGQRLVTVSDGDAAWLWDTGLLPPLPIPLRHARDVRRAVFSPDGRKVATASWDGTARVWDALTGQPLTDLLKCGELLNEIRFSPDGLRLATASDRVQVWDAATGMTMTGPLQRGRQSVNCVRFSSDGQRLVSASSDKAAHVWNASTGKLLAEFRHSDRVNCAQFSPDGQWVATACYDGTARVWDAHTGHALTSPLQHDGSVHWVEFSPDGQRIATASKDRTVRLWDARTGQMLLKPLMHADDLYHYYSVQFSPDGTRVAVNAGSTAQIWDARTGEPLLPPLKHESRVNSVRFSPDGQRLVTSSHDATARIWDVATGHLLREPLRHSARVHYAEFSPDGRFVVTGSTDGTAQVWEAAVAPLPIPDWLPALAEAVAGQRIDSREISTIVPVNKLFVLKQRLGGKPGSGLLPAHEYYAAWAQRFFEDSAMRALSPLPLFTASRLAVSTNAVELAHAARSLAVATNLSSQTLRLADALSGRAVSLAPNDAEVLETRAEALERNGDRAGALAVLDQATKRQPTSPALWNRKGALQWEANRTNEALQSISQAVQLASRETRSTAIEAEARLARARLLLQMNRPDEAASDNLLARHIPPRDPQAPASAIDLSAYYNATMTGLPGGPANHLTNLPAGLQEFDGTQFDVRAVVHLRHPIQLDLPLSVEGIRVNLKCQRLHFLHSVAHALKPESGLLVGRYVIHFADGKTAVRDLKLGVDLWDWHFDPNQPKPTQNSKVAWSGNNDAAKRYNHMIQVFKSTWDNPRPDVTVESIDYISANAGPGPFLIAITAEPYTSIPSGRPLSQ